MSVLFVDGLLIDGLGGYAEHFDVLVEGPRLARIGPSLGVERADRMIDLQGRAIMPGLIDCHAHPGGGDYDPDAADESVGLQALRTAAALRDTLQAGVTTVRNAGVGDFVDVDAREAIAAGLLPGPRLLACGPVLRPSGPYLAADQLEIDGVWNVRQAVRAAARRGVNAIKLLASGPVGRADDLDLEGFSADELAAAVDEARRLNLPTLAHCLGKKGAGNAIAAGVDSIDHGIFLTEQDCAEMARRGIFLVPTFGPFHAYRTKRLAEPWRCELADALEQPHRESFQLALASGVPIAMGCDCGGASRLKNGENPLECKLMVDNGLSTEQAIVSAAINAARLLRLESEIGSLEVGKRADLIVVDGNPLDDIAVLQDRVRLVMRDGVLYRDELDGEIATLDSTGSTV